MGCCEGIRCRCDHGKESLGEHDDGVKCVDSSRVRGVAPSIPTTLKTLYTNLALLVVIHPRLIPSFPLLHVHSVSSPPAFSMAKIWGSLCLHLRRPMVWQEKDDGILHSRSGDVRVWPSNITEGRSVMRLLGLGSRVKCTAASVIPNGPAFRCLLTRG
jgi:hypothetical protein